MLFNNVEINRSLEKNITAQLTHAPKEKADQHSAILCLNLTNVYIDIKDKVLANKTVKSYCKQFIFCFEVVQTIYFGVSSSANIIFFKFLIPPPPEK